MLGNDPLDFYIRRFLRDLFDDLQREGRCRQRGPMRHTGQQLVVKTAAITQSCAIPGKSNPW